jgi:hypothetical protein
MPGFFFFGFRYAPCSTKFPSPLSEIPLNHGGDGRACLPVGRGGVRVELGHEPQTRFLRLEGKAISSGR